jgi:hypothetical protein
MISEYKVFGLLQPRLVTSQASRVLGSAKNPGSSSLEAFVGMLGTLGFTFLLLTIGN